MTVARDAELRAVVRNIFICYFLSGAAGLVYQVLWLRKLLLVFGSTVYAVAAVLTVFFGGLALGSWWFGRLIDRHEEAGLRWYAALEAGIGLYAFVTLPLFDAIQQLYIPLYRASGFSTPALVASSFACSALILLVPTTLLGGTFPVLSRFLIRTSEERGVKIAGLYGINTAGAMAGTLLVYFVGLPVLGLFRTLLCAGVSNLGIGVLCLAFDRHLESLGFRRPAPASPAAVSAPEESPLRLRWLLAAFGLSGFSAMVYEVAWTRTLSLVVGSSTYAFCIMLATFLGGMAAGSAWARRALRQRPATIPQFITIEIVLGLYGLFSIPFFNQLPEWFVRLWPLTGGSFTGMSWLQFVLCASAMIIPTYLMGFLFPVVSDLVTRRFAHLGRQLGSAYAINTLGGIAGSFLAGFVLIPLLGLPLAIVVAAIINLLAAGILYLQSGTAAVWLRVALTTASLLGAVVLSHTVILPVWRQQLFAAGAYLNPENYRNTTVGKGVASSKILYYKDSLNATVSVHQVGEAIFLKVGGKTDASSGLDMGTQVLSAHIPLLLHDQPQSVLVIGLGSGVTLGQAGRHPVTTLHCAELDPAVIEAARFFKAQNDGVHDDPRVTIFPADGRNFLLASPRQYDVIISEPSNPWMSGIGYLFTQEFYRLAKRRLAPGGLMAQWLQLYRITPGDVKLILKTFHAEFPHVSVWSTLQGDLLLVGSMTPHQRTYEQLARRMALPAVREGLAAVRVTTPEVLLQSFLFGAAELEQLTSDAPWVHVDDQPWLEFSAPKALYLGPIVKTNADGLERFQISPQSLVPDYDASREDEAFYQDLGAMWSSRLQFDKARKALEQAVAVNPASSEARGQLGALYLRLQEFLKAEAALTQAAALAPDDPKPYRLLARLHWQQQQRQLAQQFYLQAASLEVPDSAFAEELGDCWKEDHYAVAAEFYRSAMSQDGGGRPALVGDYAEVLTKMRSWTAAEHVLTFGVRAFPEDAGFPEKLGEAWLAQGRTLDAESSFQRALAVAPGTAQAYYGLARIALSQGRSEQALQYLRTGLRYDPYHRDALALMQRIQHGKT
ncbi:MAG: fused MFS/spermidine synthase [Candidatus Omnitrophica bacterium]|nr:fused MFS/spermidine synthase [Candidatus Omnitrophota bacterium]